MGHGQSYLPITLCVLYPPLVSTHFSSSIVRQARPTSQFDCHQDFIEKITRSCSPWPELSFRYQSKTHAGKALQVVTMHSMSLQATLYFFHHVILPPKLPQADDWKAEYEDTLLGMTVEALQTFGKAVQIEQPQVTRYAHKSHGFSANYIESFGEHTILSEISI